MIKLSERAQRAGYNLEAVADLPPLPRCTTCNDREAEAGSQLCWFCANPAPAKTWKSVYFVRPDRRLVDVTGLQADDSLDFAVAHARHSARADEHEVEVLYTNDARERFTVRPEDRPRAD